MSAVPQVARSKTSQRTVFSFFLTTFALLVAACGGDGEKGPPEGYVLETVFSSSRPGYEIARKDDWVAEKGKKSGSEIYDLYSSPEKSGNFSPNVNVYCDTTGAKSGTDNFSKIAVDDLAKEQIVATMEKKVPIVGAQAQLVTFTSGYDFAQIYATDVNCGWVITLTVPKGERDKYMPTFLTMAKTFKRY